MRNLLYTDSSIALRNCRVEQTSARLSYCSIQRCNCNSWLFALRQETFCNLQTLDNRKILDFLTSVAISSSNAVLFCNHMNFNCSFSITIHLHIATLRQTPYTVLRNYQKTLWEGCEKHGANNTTHIIDFF